MENRQGEGKNSVGNVEAKELRCIIGKYLLTFTRVSFDFDDFLF